MDRCTFAQYIEIVKIHCKYGEISQRLFVKFLLLLAITMVTNMVRHALFETLVLRTLLMISGFQYQS